MLALHRRDPAQFCYLSAPYSRVARTTDYGAGYIRHCMNSNNGAPVSRAQFNNPIPRVSLLVALQQAYPTSKHKEFNFGERACDT